MMYYSDDELALIWFSDEYYEYENIEEEPEWAKYCIVEHTKDTTIFKWAKEGIDCWLSSTVVQNLSVMR